jgi:hypothetical protein
MPLTPLDFYKKYGHPKEQNNLVVWDVPSVIEIGFIPKKIYCNKDLIEPLSIAFANLINNRVVDELKTWDGCYNFRPIRGREAVYNKLLNSGDLENSVKYLSIHSWGCAVDVNAFENGLGVTPKLSEEFVKCFTDAGFDWGGNFKRLDGMHFQLAII